MQQVIRSLLYCLALGAGRSDAAEQCGEGLPTANAHRHDALLEVVAHEMLGQAQRNPHPVQEWARSAMSSGAVCSHPRRDDRSTTGRACSLGLCGIPEEA